MKSQERKSTQDIRIQKPTLPKGGGSVQGMGETFAPNSFNGSPRVSIPIPASECRGFEPHLSLNYSSGNGNSPFGMGWELSVPEIVRRTSLKIPTYDDTDTFLYTAGDYMMPRLTLNGDPMISTAQIGNNQYTIYFFILCKEGGFDKIERYINVSDSTDDFWKITSAENSVRIFGKSAGAKIFDPQNPTRIFKWLIEETYNDKGDHQVYVYQKENRDNVPEDISETKRDKQTQAYLSSVYYGNFSPVTDGSIVTGESKTAFIPDQWHFQIAFDYGVYNIDPTNKDPHTIPGGNTWPCRTDPFSEYSSGFEIRTYRLCQNILLFHRFDVLGKKPTLISALQLAYSADSLFTKRVKDYFIFTQLISVTHTGYRYMGVQTPPYETKSIPELSFSYTLFPPLSEDYQPHSFELLINESQQRIVQDGNGPFYQLVDLYGEGIPGILYQDGQSVFYRGPAKVTDSLVEYEEPVPVNFPVAGKISPDHILTDVTGRGRLDLALTSRQLAGFWEMGDSNEWKSFIPFESFPTNYHYPLNNFIDVTGDGVADVVLISDSTVQYNTSINKKGFDAAQQVLNAVNMPENKSNCSTEILFYADIIGSGLSQRVRVTQNKVECWPNLGYGSFGEKVVMNTPPDFGPGFDINRLLWADINGSGLIDLAYIHPTHISIYFNQSGNGFSTTPVSIPFPTNWDNLSQISFADVKGNGTNCLVFVQTHPDPKIWYYDFNLVKNPDNTFTSQKPYLLCMTDNNMGAITSIKYSGSTKFYLKDKRNGTRWITHLPYPVNVMESVTHHDQISLSTACSTYHYSHGYYDSHEKEFRGFGRVDVINSENFDQFIAQKDSTLAAYHSPNAFIRTWYHTGAFLEHNSLIDQFKKEFWQGDDNALRLKHACFKFLAENQHKETLRDAHRTLYGAVIRSEVYGNDDSPWQNIPYTVSESEFEVKEIQQRFNNLYSSFILQSRQSISYDYERNKVDPRISHQLALDHDFFGHVLESCIINYPRRSVNIPPEMDAQTKAQQSQLRVSYYTEIIFDSNEADGYWNVSIPKEQIPSGGYLIGINVQSKSYEVLNLIPDLKNEYFSWSGIQTQIASALTYGKDIDLLGWERSYFYDTANQKELPLGNIVIPALHHRSESVEFNINKLNSDFIACLSQQQLDQLLTGRGANGAFGGYTTFNTGSDADNYYWNPGSSQSYGNETSFFLPTVFYDAFRNETSYSYDNYYLHVNEVKDALSNTIQSKFDYQTLQPIKVTDINGNITSVLFDALGAVIATSQKGKQQGQSTGFSDLSAFTPFTEMEIDEAFEDPLSVLYNPSWMTVASFFDYDLHSWKSNKIPIHSKTVIRNYYSEPQQPTQNPLYQFEVIYQDGFGRAAQQKAYYDGTAQWQTSGTVRYDNKGQKVEIFEPWFDSDYKYRLKATKISELIFYDAIGRTVLEKKCNSIKPNAEDFFSKTLFGTQIQSKNEPSYSGYLNTKLYSNLGKQNVDGKNIFNEFQPSAWSTLNYDENDNTLESSYNPVAGNNVDADAWAKARAFANTPFQNIEDSMGNVVQKGQMNVPKVEQNNNYFTFDILGDELTSADQRLHPHDLNNFQYSYNLSKEVVKTISVDAGTKWELKDAIGNIIFSCDSRNTQQYYLYDNLHRLSSLYVVNESPPGKLQSLAQTTRMIIYGDSLNNGSPFFNNPEYLNLRGEAVILLDEAGLILNPSFSINKQPLLNAQWIKSDYQGEADWNSIISSVVSSLINLFQGKCRPTDFNNLQLPAELNNLLDAPAYITSADFDAIGRTILTIDADGNSSLPVYYSNGWIKGLSANAGTLVKAADANASSPGFSDVQYNERGQRTSISYGNGTQINYSYDAYSYELMDVKTTKNSGSTIIQDLHYHHDPVGNVTSVKNLAIPTVFFRNQQVDALSSYTYNSLYSLVIATGREHQGLWQNVQTNQNKFNKSFLSTLFNANGQPISNPQALQNYMQQFIYDVGGNLIQMQKIGNNAYTRNNIIASDSNQMTGSSIGGSPAANYDYDNNGNMTSLDGCTYVTWNYRNNMQSVVTVERSDGENDAEYYVYDAGGERVRKIHRKKTGTGWDVKETLYVGGIEIKRSYTGSSLNIKKEWHSVKQEDDEDIFCIWQYWVTGDVKPEEKKVQLRYQLYDALNSSTYELDETANLITYEEYYPFGGTSIIAAENETEIKNKHYHYSFKEKDNVTGLYYYGMRYYATWLGRWTCTDPAGTIDGLNIYAFVEEDPETYVDNQGMSCKRCGKTGHNIRTCRRAPKRVGKKIRKEKRTRRARREPKREIKGARLEATAQVRNRKAIRRNTVQGIVTRDNNELQFKEIVRVTPPDAIRERVEKQLHGHAMFVAMRANRRKQFLTAKAGGAVKTSAPQWMAPVAKGFSYDLMKFLSHTEGKLFSSLNSVAKFEEYTSSFDRLSGTATFDLRGNLAMCSNCQRALLSLQLHPSIAQYYKHVTFNYWADNHDEQVPASVRNLEGGRNINQFDHNGMKHTRVINHYFTELNNAA